MLASALAVGVAAGLVTGGSLKRLGALQIVWVPLLVVAVAVRLAAPLAPFAPLALYLASFAGLVAVAWANRRLPGAKLIGAGALLNLAVIGLNGGMPVDLGAAAAVGSAGPHDPLHLPLGPDAKFALFADIIPIALVRNVYSVGDVIDACGAFWLAFRVVRG